jgi:3'-5' exonuclease
VLDTYFVFLRSRVLFGEITLDHEQGLIAEIKTWLTKRAPQSQAFATYLARWGDWSNPWS